MQAQSSLLGRLGWLGSQVRGRLLLALSYHLLLPEGWHHWGEETGELAHQIQPRGGERGGKGDAEELGWVEGWSLGLMEEQKGVELSKELGERGVGWGRPGRWGRWGRAQVLQGEFQGRLLPVHL